MLLWQSHSKLHETRFEKVETPDQFYNSLLNPKRSTTCLHLIHTQVYEYSMVNSTYGANASVVVQEHQITSKLKQFEQYLAIS